MQALYICLFNPFPSFSCPSLLFHFLALVSFLARSKPKISFLGLSSTLATQATFLIPLATLLPVFPVSSHLITT